MVIILVLVMVGVWVKLVVGVFRLSVIIFIFVLNVLDSWLIVVLLCLKFVII